MIEDITGSRGGVEFGPVPGTGNSGDSFDRREVCMLVNGVDYFLHHVFIMVERIGYRLVVIHAGQVRTNRCYEKLTHAKIAFARMYNRKAWKQGVKADWTKLYKPDSQWLSKKIKMLKKYLSL